MLFYSYILIILFNLECSKLFLEKNIYIKLLIQNIDSNYFFKIQNKQKLQDNGFR